MNNYKRFLESELFLLAFGKFLQMLLLFAAVRVFTTFLSVEEVGNLVLMLAVATFFGLALINPVGNFLNRRLNDWESEGTVLQHFFTFNTYNVFIAVIAFATPYLLQSVNIGHSIDPLSFSIAISLFVFFNTWNQTLIPSLNLFFYRKAFVLFTLLSTSLYLVFSTLLVVFYKATAFWWLVGQATGLGVGFLVAFLFFKKVMKKEEFVFPRISVENIKSIVRFSAPLSVATFLLWSLGNFYKLIVEAEVSTEALAYIGLGLTLAVSLSGAVETLMMQVFHAHFYKGLSVSQNQNDREQVFQEFINNTLPMVSGALFVLICLSPYLVTLLADERYASVYIFVMVGVAIEFIKIFTNILSHAAHSEYKTHKNILPYFVGSVVSSAGVLVSVHFSSWQFGIVFSLILGWLCVLLLMLKSAKKLLNYYIPWKKAASLLISLFPIAIFAFALNAYAKELLPSLSVIIISLTFTAYILFKHYQKRSLDEIN